MKNRQLRIIELLLDRGKTNLLAISKLFKVSTRTIRNDIDEINYELNKFSISRIENHRGNLRLSLTSSEKEKVSKIIQRNQFLSAYERRLSIILDFVKYPQRIRIYQEMESLNISKSTMDNDMRQVRKYLARFSLRLNVDSGAEIVGDEKNIRTMLQQLVLENVDVTNFWDESEFNDYAYSIVEKFFGIECITISRSMTRQLIETVNKNENVGLEVQILLLIATWLFRIKRGQFLNKDVNFDFTLDNVDLSIKQIIKKYIHNLEDIPRNEISYIYFYLKSLLGSSKTNLKYWTKTQLLSVKLMQYMSQVEGVNYSDFEKLYELLVTHILALLERKDHNINIYNPLTSMLKENYREIFNDISDFFAKEKISISEEEIAYLTVYFGTYYEKSPNLGKVHKVVILCNYGEATGHLLKLSNFLCK